MHFRLILLPIITLFSLHAGVSVISTTKMLNSKKEATSVETQLDGNRMKIKALEPNRGNQKHDFIFLANKKLIFLIDHIRKTYSQIDETTAKSMSSKMGDSLQQLESQMANLPAAQREKMKAMMSKLKQPDSGNNKSKLDIKKTGEKKTINGYSCLKYEMWENGNKIQDMWISKWKDVGINKNDFNVFKQLGAFTQKIASYMGGISMVKGMQNSYAKAFEAVDGFPILIKQFRQGKPFSETTMSKPKNKNFSDTSFKVPSGYKKQNLMPSRK